MFSQELFLLSSNQFLFPSSIFSLPCKLLFFNCLCFFVGSQFLLPHPLNLSFMLLLLHSSFLLGHLFDAILFGESLHHLGSKFFLHSLFFFDLSSFSFFSFLFCPLHLVLLPQSFFMLHLFLSSHFGLILFLVQLPSQKFDFLCFPSLSIFLFFEFFKYFILCFFFLLLHFFYRFLSSI